jgi:hypothetical protein
MTGPAHLLLICVAGVLAGGWPVAALLIVTAYGDGLLGFRLARRVRAHVLRGIVIVFGVAVAVVLLAT